MKTFSKMKNDEKQKIKDSLDKWTSIINSQSFIERDPVQFPRKYTLKQDIEIVSVLVSTISWGNRKMILNSAQKMLSNMGNSPYDYVMSKGYLSLGTKNIHRTFFENDLKYICTGLNKIFENNTSLENVFSEPADLWQGISNFRSLIVDANSGLQTRHISNPEANSACKRIHMALRWLVRNDGIVDLGIWHKINPSQLFIPLDVHVGRIARDFKLLERNQNDRKSVEILTSQLREFCPEDPVKYDFALFGIGEQGLSIL